MSHSIRLHIFVADDDPDDRLLIRDAFLENSHTPRLDFFTDGDAIMTGLAEAGQRGHLPQLILLDLNMPGKGGREVIAELKGDATLRHIPVIVLTTSSNEDDIVACYDLGASSYIVKPVSYDGLVAITRSLKHYWIETNVLPGQARYYV